MFHILHIVESFGAGCFTGLENLVSVLQKDARHSIAYALRRETPKAFEQYFPPEVRFYHIQHLQREISLYKDFSTLFTLIKLMRKIQPSLVHCHSSKAGALGRLATFYVGIPCIYTPHGYAFLQEDLPWAKQQIYWWAEKVAAFLGSGVIACGEQEYHISKTLNSKRKLVVQINNSLDTDFLDMVKPISKNNPNRLRAGICGRVAVPRNPELFVGIASSCPMAEWVWIGAEEQDHDVLPGFILSTGWLEHEKAIAWMDSLDIYIQTSRWEGLPYSVLEAMGMGKPVVLTDIPSNRALVRHGETGFLGKTPEEMIHYTQLLLADSQLREKIGAAARDYVRKHHNMRVEFMKYLDVYQALLPESKVSSR